MMCTVLACTITLIVYIRDFELPVRFAQRWIDTVSVVCLPSRALASRGAYAVIDPLTRSGVKLRPTTRRERVSCHPKASFHTQMAALLQTPNDRSQWHTGLTTVVAPYSKA